MRLVCSPSFVGILLAAGVSVANIVTNEPIQEEPPMPQFPQMAVPKKFYTQPYYRRFERKRRSR